MLLLQSASVIVYDVLGALPPELKLLSLEQLFQLSHSCLMLCSHVTKFPKVSSLYGFFPLSVSLFRTAAAQHRGCQEA